MSISSISGYNSYNISSLLAKTNLTKQQLNEVSSSSLLSGDNSQGVKTGLDACSPPMRGGGAPLLPMGKSMAEMKELREAEARVLDGTATDEDIQDVLSHMKEVIGNRPELADLPEELQASVAGNEDFQAMLALEAKVVDGSATLQDLQAILQLRPEKGIGAGPPPGPHPSEGGPGKGNESDEQQIKTLLDYLMSDEDDSSLASFLQEMFEADEASEASKSSGNLWAKQWLDAVVKAYTQDYSQNNYSTFNYNITA